MQYVVPFFQRAYVWDSENWDALWEHLTEVSERLKSGAKAEHFIGTIVAKQIQARELGENRFDLIDGQQRLTTFCLLLKAIAFRASGNAPLVKLKQLTNDLVAFEDTRGVKHLRIEHSRNDKDQFEAVLLGESTDAARFPRQEHRILECFRYFLAKLDGYSDEELDNLKTVVLNNVPVVYLLLSADDDEQEIFDTINSLGVRLTTAELLKNFIFKDKAIQPFYDTLWASIFEQDEEAISFWNKTKNAGRVPRKNLEMLLYSFIIISTRKETLLVKLFSEYKAWLVGKSLEERKELLVELKEYAEIYMLFPEGAALNEIAFSEREKRFFHIIENLDITTVYPLALFLYKRIPTDEVRANVLSVLESYLVRRNICRFTTKNYNNLFIQIIDKLQNVKSITEKTVRELFAEYKEESNRFPTDADVRNAFATEAISNGNAREILFCIALHDIDGPKSDSKKLSSDSFSLEHMMPRQWEDNWNDPTLDDNGKLQRTRKLKTLGNCTLVTGSLNSSMRNAAWNLKKEALKKNSRLALTTDYVELPAWNEAEIDKRGSTLANKATSIWK